jgi:hypothetical protein
MPPANIICCIIYAFYSLKTHIAVDVTEIENKITQFLYVHMKRKGPE